MFSGYPTVTSVIQGVVCYSGQSYGTVIEVFPTRASLYEWYTINETSEYRKRKNYRGELNIKECINKDKNPWKVRNYTQLILNDILPKE